MNRLITFLLFVPLCAGCKSPPEPPSLEQEAPAPQKVAAPPVGGAAEPEPNRETPADIRNKTLAEKRSSPALPRLLVFSRDNCLPCEIMAPWVERTAQKYEGRLETLKLNLDRPEARSLGRAHRISTVPTQVYINSDGEEVFRHLGLATETELLGAIRRYLPGTDSPVGDTPVGDPPAAVGAPSVSGNTSTGETSDTYRREMGER